MKAERSHSPNPVAQVVALLGGPSAAARVCEVSEGAIYKWRKKGICPDTRCACLLSEAVHGAVAVRDLGGLEPKPDPTGRGGAGLVPGDTAYTGIATGVPAPPAEAEVASLRPRRLYAPPSDTSGRRHTRAKKNRYSRYISIPLLHQAAIEALVEVLGHSIEDDELLAWAA